MVLLLILQSCSSEPMILGKWKAIRGEMTAPTGQSISSDTENLVIEITENEFIKSKDVDGKIEILSVNTYELDSNEIRLLGNDGEPDVLWKYSLNETDEGEQLVLKSGDFVDGLMLTIYHARVE